jgi:hypothetical protein
MKIERDKVKDFLSKQIIKELDENNHKTLNQVLAYLDNENLWECLAEENREDLWKSIKDEETVPITFFQIKNGPGWSKYCDVAGGNHYAISEGYNPNDREIFDVKRKHARELGLI